MMGSYELGGNGIASARLCTCSCPFGGIFVADLYKEDIDRRKADGRSDILKTVERFEYVTTVSSEDEDGSKHYGWYWVAKDASGEDAGQCPWFMLHEDNRDEEDGYCQIPENMPHTCSQFVGPDEWIAVMFPEDEDKDCLTEDL